MQAFKGLTSTLQIPYNKDMTQYLLCRTQLTVLCYSRGQSNSGSEMAGLIAILTFESDSGFGRNCLAKTCMKIAQFFSFL